jgi:hypothetical protein
MDLLRATHSARQQPTACAPYAQEQRGDGVFSCVAKGREGVGFDRETAKRRQLYEANPGP